MKKLLIGAAAAAAIIAPSVASAQSTGVVGLSYTNTEIDAYSEETDTFKLSGAFNHAFSNGTYVQFDASAARTDFGGCCYSTGYAAAHYGVRNDTYAFGGFVSFDEVFLYSGLGIGVEGQYYLQNLVLDASLTYNEFGDVGEETVTGTVEASYFITPNVSVGGGVTMADNHPFTDDYTSWNLGGEYRFANNPVSIELGYRQSEAFDEDVNAWTIGFNIDLGADSLHDRATRGASLNGAAANHEVFGGSIGIP